MDSATEEPVIVLEEILASYVPLKDKHELIGAPSRSPVDESFNVPRGWSANIINPPRYQGIWGIAPSSEDPNGVVRAFLLQQGTQTQDGDIKDAVRYVSIDGTTITDICALTMGDLPGRNPNLSLDSITEAPEGTIYLRTYQGLIFQVFPYPGPTQSGEEAKSSLVQDGIPVCHNEVIGQSGGLWPLAVTNEGMVGYDDGTDSIYFWVKDEGKTLIADGFGRVQPDSVSLTPDNRLVFWDFLTGMHELDLDTKQDKVIYRPSNYQDSLSLEVDPNSKNIYFFEATGTLYEYNPDNGNRRMVSRKTECIWHPEAFFIKSDGSAIIGTDRASGFIYSYNFDTDEITTLQDPVNTSALDVADDGTIYAGYTGCQGSGYIKKIAPDGSTSLFSAELPVQVRKLKTQGDLIYVLGVNSLGWDILNPELTVLNQAGQVEYSVELPRLSLDNLSVLQKENALLCDHWRNRCVEAGREGVIREFTVNFNAADPTMAYQTPDQPMSMTNQAPDGSIYAYLGFNRGIVNGEPTVDRYIMEFDMESRTFTPLFETQHTGSSGSVISFDSYVTPNSDSGFFFRTGPVPMVLHHVSPEGLDYLRSTISSNNVLSLKNLLGKKIGDIPIIEVTARGLPQDSWGMGARITEDELPYVVIGGSGGYLRVSKKH